MLIGIDTSVVVGLLDSQDVWHPAAVGLQKAILSAKLEPIYFDCVLAEAVSTVARRLREKRRSAELTGFLNRIVADFQPEVITWILPDVPRLYVPALETVQSSGGELNFNDALIALACRERVVRALASFDHDFDSVTWLVRLAAPQDVETLTRPRA